MNQVGNKPQFPLSATTLLVDLRICNRSSNTVLVFEESRWHQCRNRINLPEAEVKRLMMGAAERVVIVADAAKLGQVHLGRIATLDDVDLLVTDDQADAALVDQIAARGVRVITH